MSTQIQTNCMKVLSLTLADFKMSHVMKKKRVFAYAKTKRQIRCAVNSCAVTAQLISIFVFATQIVQSLFFLLNPKCQVSSILLWLYMPVCV